jgi:hypothetical protein
MAGFATGVEPLLSGGEVVPRPVWHRVEGLATSLAVAGDGTLFALTPNNEMTGLRLVQRHRGEWRDWHATEDQAAPKGAGAKGAKPQLDFLYNEEKTRGSFYATPKVAVTPDGHPWILDVRGEIFAWRQGSWHKVPGRAENLSIGPDGGVWAISGFDRRVYHYHPGENNWRAVPIRYAVTIAAGLRGTVYAMMYGVLGPTGPVNNGIQVYQTENDMVRNVPGSATSIAVGGDGSVWAVSQYPPWQGLVFRLTDNQAAWMYAGWGADDIAVEPNGLPYMIAASGRIYQLRPREQ